MGDTNQFSGAPVASGLGACHQAVTVSPPCSVIGRVGFSNMADFPRKRIVVMVAALLWLAHVGVVITIGSGGRGPFLSDLIQLAIGAVLIYSLVAASRGSEGLARSFWLLSAVAYALWFVAQGLSVYNDLAASPIISWTNNMLFCFWFVPLAMAMVLDPDMEKITLLNSLNASARN